MSAAEPRDLQWDPSADDIEAYANVLLHTAENIRLGFIEAAPNPGAEGWTFRITDAGKRHVENMTREGVVAR